jgi:hypothetical protein
MNTTVIAAQPTAKQIERLLQLGYNETPRTRSEASATITRILAQRDMQPATQRQINAAGALGGRDLPGAGVREKSTQIYLLEALAIFDSATEGAEANEAAEVLIARVRERFAKAAVAKPVMPQTSDEAPM